MSSSLRLRCANRSYGAVAVEQELQRRISFTAEIGVEGYPALVLAVGESSRWPVGVDYNNHLPMVDAVEFLLED